MPMNIFSAKHDQHWGTVMEEFSLPCNKSTDGKKRTSELSKLKQSCEANRLQLMKQDLEKARRMAVSLSKTLPGATAAAHSKWQE
ncbi:hypothetical protein TNCV_4818961 [Trichonephila clavipes]|nr:hypothetical protein TNCV_4818961 [Trichonephila clavipes]